MAPDPYGRSAGEDSWKKQSWPIFMPGHSLIGSVATFDSSSVMWPSKPGVDEARRRVGEEPEAAEGTLAFEARGDIVGQSHLLVGGAEHELTRAE